MEGICENGDVVDFNGGFLDKKEKMMKKSLILLPLLVLVSVQARTLKERVTNFCNYSSGRVFDAVTVAKIGDKVNPLGTVMDKNIAGLPVRELVKPEFIKALNEELCFNNAPEFVKAIADEDSQAICNMIAKKLPGMAAGAAKKFNFPAAAKKLLKDMLGTVANNKIFKDTVCPLEVRINFFGNLPQAVKDSVATLEADLPKTDDEWADMF